MTFLPIAERELRVAARSSRTYWSRALAALVILILAAVMFQSYSTLGRARAAGRQVFSALSYMALAYAVFAGAALTADCLSSEKREETLGLLFLTDLKGYDVVLGKLCATSLRSIYGLLATFPIMSLALLLGGVQATEFRRVVLVIVNTLLLSLSVGLLVSTVFRRQRVTTHLAALVMLLLALIPFGVGSAMKAISGPLSWYSDPSFLSPVYSLYVAFDPAYGVARFAGASFWDTLAVQFTLALLLLARACWLAPRSWQESTQAATRTSGSVRRSHQHADAEARRRRMLDVNPFYWLAGRGWGMQAGMISMLGFIGAWGMLTRFDRDGFAQVQGVGILMVGLVTRLLVAFAAGQRFAEDKQSGALDLIITTPLTVRALLAGQWRAIGRKLGPPVLLSFMLYWFLMFGGEAGYARGLQEANAALFTTACLVVLTLTDCIALGWLGMWAGLHYRLVPHAAGVCLAKVILPPALITGLVFWPSIDTADDFLRLHPYLLPAVWLVFGLAADLFWTAWAHHKLVTAFRLAATEHLRRAGV